MTIFGAKNYVKCMKGVEMKKYKVTMVNPALTPISNDQEMMSGIDSTSCESLEEAKETAEKNKAKYQFIKITSIDDLNTILIEYKDGVIIGPSET